MKTAFKRETKDFEFELMGSKGLFIRYKHDNLSLKLNMYDAETYTEYGYSRGMPTSLVIKDYLERIKTPEAGKIIETVLSAFYRTFKSQEDQREQLKNSLRYFALSDHYGVFKAAFPQEILESVKIKYVELIDKLSSLENNCLLTEAMINKFHINEPLIASTGLIVYATLDHNWYIFETNERHKTLPEYLYTVMHHSDFKLNTHVSAIMTDTQNACQSYVLCKQKEFYGVSLDEYRSLQRQFTMNKRLAEDFEILLDIDYKNTIQGKIETAEKEEAVKNSVESNMHILNSIKD